MRETISRELHRGQFGMTISLFGYRVARFDPSYLEARAALEPEMMVRIAGDLISLASLECAETPAILMPSSLPPQTKSARGDAAGRSFSMRLS